MNTRVSRARARTARRRSRVGGFVARADVVQLRVPAILVGGAAGTLARAGLADGIPHGANEWPWATFAANLGGALLLGWLLARLAERVAPTRYWRLLLGTGFAGALTTFSTFQIETFELARRGDVGLAIGYPLTSIVLGMACAVTGTMLARWGRHW